MVLSSKSSPSLRPREVILTVFRSVMNFVGYEYQKPRIRREDDLLSVDGPGSDSGSDGF